MTQRTAAFLDLDWKPNVDGDVYTAMLPDIPGYPVQDPSNWSDHCVQVYQEGSDWCFDMTLMLPLPLGVTYLMNDDFGIPDTDTADEMMQAVNNLTVEDIADALAAKGYEPVDDATAARHAARRTASLDLDWTNTSEDTWQADLPAIPGYTGADGNDSFVTVAGNGRTELAVPYDAVCTIFLSQGGVVNLNLWDMWSFDPFGPDAKDVMQAVDDLDVYDISHQLEQMGYEPSVNEDGEYAVAARCAAQRAGNLDLFWEEQEDGSYYAIIPTVCEVSVVQGRDGSWVFDMADGAYTLDNRDFGIPRTATADEMIDKVNQLSVAQIMDEFDAHR